MPGSVHEAQVAELTPLARAIVEVKLRVDGAPLAFRAGQFVSLRVGESVEGHAILRSYSLASPPGAALASLVVKLLPGGTASEFFGRLAPGARLRFTGPMGFFVLDLVHAGDVVFGVTGVGMAPVLPMLDELSRRDEPGRILLYWGNRDPDDVFWQDELAALARACPRLAVRRFLSGGGETPPGCERGRITTPLVSDLATLDRPVFYLVGGGGMIRDVKKELIERGVDRKKQIRNEAFFE